MKEFRTPILDRAQRVEFLFGQIEKKATAEQAYRALELHQKNLIEKKKRSRGERSEILVMEALLALSNVENIVRSKPLSMADKIGIDLTVFLINEPIPSVDVQVKSKAEAVRAFRDYSSAESNEYRPDGAEILAQRGLIVLNGRTSPPEIQNDFLVGLGNVIRAKTQQGSCPRR